MKLPLLSGRQVLAALQRLGIVEIHAKGSHVKMEHRDGRRIVFPFHAEIDRYTLKALFKTPTLTSVSSSSTSSRTSGRLARSAQPLRAVNPAKLAGEVPFPYAALCENRRTLPGTRLPQKHRQFLYTS